MSQHIVESFEIELDRMRGVILRMGRLALHQLEDALDCLNSADARLVNRTIAEDQELDALDAVVLDQAVAVLALRQPMAGDLREVVTALKIPTDLERIGDLCKGIARRAGALHERGPRPAAIRVRAMGDLVRDMLSTAMDAYAQHDPVASERVWQRDREVDDWHTGVYRELLTYMMEDPRTIANCAHLMFIAKNLERIGDHCTHIAQTTYFLAKGVRLNGRPKGEDSASVVVEDRSPAARPEPESER
jgi:phosphate transport system protein